MDLFDMERQLLHDPVLRMERIAAAEVTVRYVPIALLPACRCVGMSVDMVLFHRLNAIVCEWY
jgi:hypothetical protein